MSLLQVKGLIAGYGAATVLHGIDLSVDEGSTVVVLGANGAGKTTTLRALSGGTRNQGQVLFDGKDIAHTSTVAIAGLGVGHVPQGRGTFTNLTVAENLTVGAHARRDGRQVEKDFQTYLELFPRLGERLHQKAGMLSGGEQQMLAISRALMGKPRLLLLDEPSLGLAPIIIQALFTTLDEIAATKEVSMLIVEQNAHLALSIADYAYVLESGVIARAAPASEVLDDSSLRSAYLGY